MALAWNAARRHSGYGDPITIGKSSLPGRFEKNFTMPVEPNESIYSSSYDVEIKTKGDDEGISLMV
jgi:hypothetical protein